jgi:antitoxin component of MazEF toxin-antitoxin module
MEGSNNYHYRKVQGLVGETSFAIILPKECALNIGLGKGEFVKVHQEDQKIIIEKAQ